ncbi:MAG: elongation factor G [Clostridiales bacterium]|jgi:elongation factor G|nr:elongation factor G [Clostridiales bacterium]
MEFKTENIRNVALIGHSGEGKTSVCEAMLFNAKHIDRMGRTDDGNTVMDYDAEEAARKISVSLSVANLEWNGAKLNLIDVPGFFDFEGEFEAAMSVADCAVVVTGAGSNLSVGAEKALDYCIANKFPALVFINRMDTENANYVAAVEALKNRYANKIAPAQIPIMDSGKKMQGYVSLMSGKAYEFTPNGRKQIDIPAEYEDDYARLKDKLVDVAASNDEDLMNKFFEGGAITQDEIIFGVRKGIASGDAILVIAGSAAQNKGIINLMDQIVRVMPSPAYKPHDALDGSGSPVEVWADSAAPVSARVFKTIADPFVGRFNLFKVTSGCVRNGLALVNTTQDKQEKISGVFTMRGKKQEAADFLHAGDIGAFSKLSGTLTGDTLCEPSRKILFPPIPFPRPNLSLAVAGKAQGDEEKVFSGLARLREEDPTFNIVKGGETGETVLQGMGEIQLEILVRKLKNKFGAEAKLSTPKIPYRETVRKTVVAEGKHKKQSGGHGQYGHCFVRFEHLDGKDFEFAEEVVGGSVPKSYIPAVEKGLTECAKTGVLAGYPVVNLRCVLTDGSYHDVDSSEMAFKLAAALAFKKGCAEAGPVLLEPVMSVEIQIPDNYLGDIMGDLNRRRGRILGMESAGGLQAIAAEAPMSEMFKYSTDLRSMTQGRGRFTMELARYEEAPGNVAQALAAEYEKSRAKDN